MSKVTKEVSAYFSNLGKISSNKLSKKARVERAKNAVKARWLNAKKNTTWAQNIAIKNTIE